MSTNRPDRNPLTLIALVLSLALLAYLLAANAGEILGADDFVQYWAAGRLNLAGSNPYDGVQLDALQRSVGWDEPAPLMMWNPPWTLALVMPFGALPYITGRALWMLAGFVIIIVCADLCWRLYGGPERHRWIAGVVALLFAPTLLVLHLGQISPLVLLGIVGFMVATARERWVPAGLAAALIALKPQLPFLLWPALLMWAAWRRNWRMPMALAGALLALTGVALIANSSVVAQYLHLNRHESPFIWATPTLGAILRLFLGNEKYWLQYVPAVPAVAWLVVYSYRHRASWRWTEQMPLILLVSFLAKPFGWTYDGIIIIPGLVQSTAWLVKEGRRPHQVGGAVAHIVLSVVALSVYSFGLTDFGNVWLPPALLAFYLIVRAATAPRNAPEPALAIGE